MFVVVDITDGTLIRWNRVFNQVTGYSDEEILQRKFPVDWFNKDDKEIAGDAIGTILEGGTAISIFQLITKSGKTIPVEYSASLITYESANQRYMITIGRDITRRIKKDEEISKKKKDSN